MAGILDLMNYAQKQGEAGFAKGQNSRLNQLVSQAATAPPGQRSGLLGQVAGIDRSAAFDAQKFFADDDGRKRTEVAKRVSVLMAMPQEQRAQMYASMAPEFQAMGIPAPAQYDPSFDEPMKAIAAAYGGGAAGIGVQSTYIDAQGNRVAIMRDGSTQVLGQNAPQMQLIEGQGGYYGVNKTNLQAAPVQIGQPGTMPAQQRAPGEVPFSIDPSLPPAIQASIRANESQWAAAPDGASVTVGTPGSPMGAMGVGGMAEQLRKPEKEPDAPTGYRFAQDGTLVAIPGGPADTPDVTPADQAKEEMGVRKEVADLVKESRTVLTMYDKVRAAAAQPSAPNDLAMIFAYMKMLDPGSVVREQEFANAQNAAGVPDQVRNAWNKALSGERLNPTQRSEFVNSAQQIADAAGQQITRTVREYQGTADQYGFDPRRATGFADFRNVNQPGTGPSAPTVTTQAQYDALPSGAIYMEDGVQYRKP